MRGYRSLHDPVRLYVIALRNFYGSDASLESLAHQVRLEDNSASGGKLIKMYLEADPSIFISPNPELSDSMRRALVDKIGNLEALSLGVLPEPPEEIQAFLAGGPRPKGQE